MGHLVDQPSPMSKQGVFAWLDLKAEEFFGATPVTLDPLDHGPGRSNQTSWCLGSSLAV